LSETPAGPTEEGQTNSSQQRGDSARTRTRSGRGSLIWTLALLALLLVASGCASVAKPDGWAPAAATGGTLYLSVDSGELAAVDAETFDRLWVFPDGDEAACGDEDPQKRDLDGLYAAPLVAGGLLYFGAWDGNVYALDAETGDCQWDYETDDPIIGGLTLNQDRIFVASTDGTLYALDPVTGDEIARTHAGDVWSRPLISGGVLYVGTMDGAIKAFDPETLEQTWDEPFDINAGLLTDPTPSDGSILAGGIGETLYAINAETGEEQWSFGASSWFWGTLLVSEGIVYATNLDGTVYAVDLETGERVWQYATEAPVRAGAVFAGGVIIAVDDKGNIYGLDPETGAEAWNPQSADTKVLADPYVLSDGMVVVVARNGDVFLVDPEDGIPREQDINE